VTVAHVKAATSSVRHSILRGPTHAKPRSLQNRSRYRCPFIAIDAARGLPYAARSVCRSRPFPAVGSSEDACDSLVEALSIRLVSNLGAVERKRRVLGLASAGSTIFRAVGQPRPPRKLHREIPLSGARRMSEKMHTRRNQQLHPVLPVIRRSLRRAEPSSAHAVHARRGCAGNEPRDRRLPPSTPIACPRRHRA
jgi:hypothetical protein